MSPDRDEAQRERALQAWGLAVLDPPSAELLRALRRVLRFKRFEMAALSAALPGVVRRGARVDLEPLRAALEEAGVRCELQRTASREAAKG